MPIWLITFLTKVVLPVAIQMAEKLGWANKVEGWVAQHAALTNLAITKLQDQATAFISHNIKIKKQYPTGRNGPSGPTNSPAQGQPNSNINQG